MSESWVVRRKLNTLSFIDRLNFLFSQKKKNLMNQNKFPPHRLTRPLTPRPSGAPLFSSPSSCSSLFFSFFLFFSCSNVTTVTKSGHSCARSAHLWKISNNNIKASAFFFFAFGSPRKNSVASRTSSRTHARPIHWHFIQINPRACVCVC